MTEKKPFVRPGVRLIVINRGDMQSIFPLDETDLKSLRGADLGTAAAMQFFEMQKASKRKPTHPIDSQSKQMLALQYLDGEFLYAHISLASQLEGKWDEQEVPEGFRNEYTGKAPFVELNLVDTSIVFR